jgi:hypothetical protein
LCHSFFPDKNGYSFCYLILIAFPKLCVEVKSKIFWLLPLNTRTSCEHERLKGKALSKVRVAESHQHGVEEGGNGFGAVGFHRLRGASGGWRQLQLAPTPTAPGRGAGRGVMELKKDAQRRCSPKRGAGSTVVVAPNLVRMAGRWLCFNIEKLSTPSYTI